jgi:16S rRNA processing protein RimM
VPRPAHPASRRARPSTRAGSSRSAPPPAPAPALRAADPADAAFVTLAKIVRVRGRIGEVAATILSDFPERFTKLREALLLDPAGRRRRVRIRRCWLASSHGGQAIFHFEGVNSISEAQQFVGCEVQIPLAQRAPLPAGRYFISDLIGCEVFEVMEVQEVLEVLDQSIEADMPESSAGSSAETESSMTSTTSTTSRTSRTSLTSLGLVRDVHLETGTPLLVVATATGELLIPFADEICTRIDPAARRIEVRLPPGLRELNP